MPLHYGDIIEGEILDPDGRNKKRRPLLVISFDEEIAKGEPLIVLGITRDVPDPLTPDAFLLPHGNGVPHAVTGLTARSVVKCQWITVLAQSDVFSKKGRATGKVLFQVSSYLAKHPPPRGSGRP